MARARVWATAIRAELGPDQVGAFLAWGDPSLYDSTLRILDAAAAEVDISYDVIPGITIIPSGTWGVNRAQESGCTYCAGG